MAKKIVGYIKLQVPAGKANPSPPIGPALGQRGLNIMEFCKAFNAKTADLEVGMPNSRGHHRLRRPHLHVRDQDSPVSYFLKKASGKDKGSTTPGKGGFVGSVTTSQVREIAQKKMVDLNAHDVEAAATMIAGSARSMGLEVVEG